MCNEVRERGSRLRRRWIAMLMLGMGITACTTAGNSALVGNPAQPPNEKCVAPATWVIPERGALSVPTLLGTLGKRKVVLLGEYHDDVMHHAWQLGVISGLAAHHAELVIGLEMLPRSAQPALDRWIRGEIDEKEFARESQWWEYWKFDPQLYMPILRFAQLHQIPVYGLNVERALVTAVRTKGWENIPPAERYGISDPAPPSTDYLETLALSYSMHGVHGGKDGRGAQPNVGQLKADPGFQRFVQGQQLWDRGIAHAIVDIASRHPTAKIVGLMGSGHLMDRAGVPHQLADLGMEDTAVLLPWDEAFDCEMLKPGFADAVFGVRSVAIAAESDGPKLGVQIEPARQGVRVAKVVAGSIAAVAGMHDNDLLVKLGGRDVQNVEDVIATVRAMLPGAWLPVTVQRGEQQLELVAKFPFRADAPTVRQP